MRKLVLLLMLSFYFCISNVHAVFSGGNGTSQSPYIIASVSDWQTLMSSSSSWGSGAVFSLVLDLDFKDLAITPVGISGMPFRGEFRGNGHVIKNVSITYPADVDAPSNYGVGLFGFVVGYSEITDLHIENALVSGFSSVGSLIGCTTNNVVIITNCSVKGGSVQGTRAVGGLTGSNGTGRISSCFSDVSVQGVPFSYGLGYGQGIGGFAGANGGAINDCYATGAVSGQDFRIGGFVGSNTSYVGINRCYSTGRVSASAIPCYDIGGFAGNGGQIIDCFWDKQTSGWSTSQGGTGKTTTEMKTLATFASAGWDFFDTWEIVEDHSYPSLLWQEMGNHEIHNAADWQELMNSPEKWGQAYVLKNSIDLQGLDLIPVGSSSTPFTGVIDGRGHTILNATILAPNDLCVGLFGVLGESGQIKNLHLMNANITGCDYVGGLAGANMQGTISDCSVDGVMTGDAVVGGLTGLNFYGTIERCSSTGDIYGYFENLGGLIGENESGIIKNCYSQANVTGLILDYYYAARSMGGLIGSAWCSIRNYDITIMNSYATGLVTYGHEIGGFIGTKAKQFVPASNPIIGNCFWDIETSGCSYAVGWGSEEGVTGKTTAEMQDPNTFLSAGWDFVNESTNGTEDVWQVLEAQYPTLLRYISVPDLVDKTQSEAEFEVELGLETGTINYCYSYATVAGQVIGQYPKPGTFVKCGMRVNIQVSLGPGGAGTSEDPYLIATKADWQQLMATPADWNKHFVLNADISLSGLSLNPVGNSATNFTGTLDGNRHIISNISVVKDRYNSANTNIGLFGYIGLGGRIENLDLKNACATGYGFIGILAGRNTGGVIKNCSASGTVRSGYYHAGGLIGLNGPDGTVSCCRTQVNVICEGEGYAGGLIGFNSGAATISNCYAQGSVEGGNSNGGLAGGNSGLIDQSYSTARAWYGLVGSNSGLVTNSLYDRDSSKCSGSSGGVGRTTAQMKALSTFASFEGIVSESMRDPWDLVGETANGVDDLWTMPAGDYPRLAWEYPIEGDFVVPYGVELSDLQVLADQWMQSGCPSGCQWADIDRDCRVNLSDFTALSLNWLQDIILGPLMIVPDVVGMDEPNAFTTITHSGFSMGTVSMAYSDVILRGFVISQEPIGGATAYSSIPIKIVRSLGPAVVVPDVTGLAQIDAESSLTVAGLMAGTITTANSDTVTAGCVISQSLCAGCIVGQNTPVDLVVSLGPVIVEVPDITGMLQADAETALVNAELMVGTVTAANSDTITTGCVISQSPAPGSAIPHNTPVNMVVSLGPVMVTVPNVTGMAQAQAEAAIVAAGLVVGTVATSYNNIVPAGCVISQNPAAATSVIHDSAVDIEISLGALYSLTVSVVGGNGIVEPQSGNYPAGSIVELQATPLPFYQVKVWMGTDDDLATNLSNTVTMNSNRTVTVEFQPIAPIDLPNSGFEMGTFDFWQSNGTAIDMALTEGSYSAGLWGGMGQVELSRTIQVPSSNGYRISFDYGGMSGGQGYVLLCGQQFMLLLDDDIHTFTQDVYNITSCTVQIVVPAGDNWLWVDNLRGTNCISCVSGCNSNAICESWEGDGCSDCGDLIDMPNGGFETGTTYWTVNHWYEDGSFSGIEVSEPLTEGNYALHMWAEGGFRLEEPLPEPIPTPAAASLERTITMASSGLHRISFDYCSENVYGNPSTSVYVNDSRIDLSPTVYTQTFQLDKNIETEINLEIEIHASGWDRVHLIIDNVRLFKTE